jgi:hypothetical protein
VRYSFFVHRTAPRWRLVIAESGSFPERTTADQWEHSRDRAEADDLAAEVFHRYSPACPPVARQASAMTRLMTWRGL